MYLQTVIIIPDIKCKEHRSAEHKNVHLQIIYIKPTLHNVIHPAWAANISKSNWIKPERIRLTTTLHERYYWKRMVRKRLGNQKFVRTFNRQPWTRDKPDENDSITKLERHIVLPAKEAWNSGNRVRSNAKKIIIICAPLSHIFSAFRLVSSEMCVFIGKFFSANLPVKFTLIADPWFFFSHP